jgi:hypothetical protein
MGATMSIEINKPEPKPKRTRAKAPTTNQRRHVPVVREPKPLRTRYASDALLSDIAQPMALIHNVEPAYRAWNFGTHTLATARKVNPLIPAWPMLLEAQQQVIAALRKPLDQPTAEMLLAMLIDAMPKGRSNDSVEIDLEVMLGVIADLGNPLAETFIDDDPAQEDGDQVEPVRIDHPISPVVLAVAVKKLINKQIFKPQPAELRKACIKAYIDVRGQSFRLEYFMRARAEIDQQLLRDGTKQEKAAARRALDMDDDDDDDAVEAQQ